MNNNDLDEEPTHKIYTFGWYPEIVGAVGVVVVIWYLINFARGSI